MMTFIGGTTIPEPTHFASLLEQTSGCSCCSRGVKLRQKELAESSLITLTPSQVLQRSILERAIAAGRHKDITQDFVASDSDDDGVGVSLSTTSNTDMHDTLESCTIIESRPAYQNSLTFNPTQNARLPKFFQVLLVPLPISLLFAPTTSATVNQDISSALEPEAWLAMCPFSGVAAEGEDRQDAIENWSARIERRTGQLEAGSFPIAFMRLIRTQLDPTGHGGADRVSANPDITCINNDIPQREITLTALLTTNDTLEQRYRIDILLASLLTPSCFSCYNPALIKYLHEALDNRLPISLAGNTPVRFVWSHSAGATLQNSTKLDIQNPDLGSCTRLVKVACSPLMTFDGSDHAVEVGW